MGHALVLWCIVEQDCCGCNSLCSKAFPADCSGSQCIPPCANTGAQPICGLLALCAFPCAGHRSIPCGGHRSIPLWKSQEQSPVEVTGAQPPSSGGLLFVSTRGVSQAVYQPLPVYLLVVWEGMHVHEVD